MTSNPISVCAISRPRNFSATFTFMSSHRKFDGVLHLDAEVVRVNARTQLHLLHHGGVLVLCASPFPSWLFRSGTCRDLTSRQTGGTASAAISTRSTPCWRARVSASLRVMTPSCLPSAPITRTSRARILPLTRTRKPMTNCGKRRGGSRDPRWLWHDCKFCHQIVFGLIHTIPFFKPNRPAQAN